MPKIIFVLIIFISVRPNVINVAGYRSEIPTFQVGSHISGKNLPHCPCEEVNSTFSHSCGVLPKVNGANIPLNGTHFGEFPWQVAITEKYEEEFLCSGILVSPRVVLTAARCIQDIPTSHLRVRLGEWDILSENKNPFETYESLEIGVSKKYLNPDLTSPSDSHGASEENNLGILKMVRPVNFDEYPHIAPVCLPMIMNNKANLSDCMVAGWSASKVVTLNDFMEMYMDDVDEESRGMKSLLLSPTCSKDKHGKHCYIHQDNQQKTTESSPIEIMLKEVDGISAQIKGKLEETVIDSEEEKNYSEKVEIFSRTLKKSVAKVLNRNDCSKLLKELNATIPRPAQICVVSHEGSTPCVGDIGSPVICKLAEEKKRNKKESLEDITSRYAVIGIITRSYSCDADNENTSVIYPVLATSISKSLDHICYTITSSSKDMKVGSFKVNQ